MRIQIDYTEQWLTKSDDFINADIHSPATTTNNQPSTTCKSTETIGSISARTKQRQRQRQRKKAAQTGQVHVKLAELDGPTSQSESESSAYDSFNEVVTGLYMHFHLNFVFVFIARITVHD